MRSVSVKLGWTAAVVVGLAMTSGALVAQGGSQAIPDSPRPQALPNAGSVTPGLGSPSGIDTSTPTPTDNAGGAAPGATLGGASAAPAAASGDPAPDLNPELGPGGRVQTLRVGVNFVQIPFTVKDKSGALVPALSWRDVRVFENGTRKQLRLFTSDPYPLSVAFVIDQSLPFDVMKTVNNALGALQGAFTPYDEMAIYSYNNGPRLRTDYTAATGARVTAVIEQSKSTGREAQLYTPDGPMSQTNYLNGKNVDANTAPNRGCPACGFQAPPKETHTLNDAIFMAAESLAKRPDGRRRIIYVISDGKELGSTHKFKDNIRFLQTNKIAVYATVVGDSATPYIGWLDHYHIPLTMRENVLPQYAQQTGGEAISEYRQRGMETSFAKIAEDVRVQYTVGYYSNEPLTDNKFRAVEVQVLKPGLDVIAKKGYYPTPENVMRNGGMGTPSATPQ
jgi:VWFA-related protein